jgi:hypothetical protein
MSDKNRFANGLLKPLRRHAQYLLPVMVLTRNSPYPILPTVKGE